MPEVITDNLDLWSSALLTKSTAGRGSNGKLEAYGIKKLRQLILELAVRGKLVPQVPNDEPALELLTRTIAEKKRLIKENVIREAKAPAYPNEEPDHELPGSWVWTNLYEIGEIAPRNEAEDTVEASFVPMQSISEKYGVPVQHEVKPWSEIKSGFTHFREEDVALAKITPCFQNGKSAVMRGLTNGFGAGTTELHVYRSINACTVPEYVLIYLKSPRFISDGIPKMTGTAGQKRITRDYFAGNYFPLSPLAEQHRIVAKVDELMALCDQLEQQQTHSIEAHRTMVETLLGTLRRVASPQELTEAWTRIANHFGTLFTTEHSIDQLKQTILQLAVMGELVPQDPNDEPASELVKKTMAEKNRLVEEKAIRETKAPAYPDQPPEYQLPAGWVWTSLYEIGEIGPRNDVDDNAEASFVPMQLISDDYGIPVQHEVKQWGEIKSGFTHFKEEDVVLAKITPCFQNGKSAVMRGLTKGFGAGTTELHVYRSINACSVPEYVLIYLKSPNFIRDGIPKMTGTAGQKRITRDYFAGNHFPLPPLVEQYRIVAKVDELMALCDALKARLADAQTTQNHLADTIVEQAVA